LWLEKPEGPKYRVASERNSKRAEGFILKVDINSPSVTEEFIPASGSCGSISIKSAGGLEGLNTEVSCSNAANPVNNITNNLTSITNNVYNTTNNITNANILITGNGNVSVGDIGVVNNTTTIDNSFTIQTTNTNLSLAIAGDSKKSEKVKGTNGGDLIADGRGKDKLIGGDGADQFYFSGEEPFKKKTVDKVIDFDASEGDAIVIADKVVGELTKDPTLAIADTKKDLKQLSKDGYDLLYFEPKGDLYVDGNGDTKGFGKKSEGGMIADLPNDTILTESDVLIGV
jgi:Ca2+-binding RTX toxin-like protein